MKYAVLTAFALALLGGAASSQNPEILIMGGDNNSEFLGCLTCSEYDPNSVWNKYSQHGWENRYGTWNKYGTYAGRYAPNSACSRYASDAPILVDRAGNYYGRLSVNRYAEGSVCGAGGADQICRALQVMCADE